MPDGGQSYDERIFNIGADQPGQPYSTRVVINDEAKRKRYESITHEEKLVWSEQEVIDFVETGARPNETPAPPKDLEDDLTRFLGVSGDSEMPFTLFERQTVLHVLNTSPLLSEEFKKVLGYKLSCLWEGDRD